jgi:glycosyltransferase involved in cell wall biosynthesis
MTFCIITHVPHGRSAHQFFAYAPYVREMNIWFKFVEKVLIVAPLEKMDFSPIHLNYNHSDIEFVPISKMDLLSFKSILMSFLTTPKVCWQIFKAMKKADHIHLRCPGNIGLLGCFIQILFPNKPKTAKYAGNWDLKSKQPLSYRIQKRIIQNTFLTRNMNVLVYGEWQGSTRNIKSFFTATYSESDKTTIFPRDLNGSISFLFVGTLSIGKRPLYTIQMVAALSKLGYSVSLQLFGDGKENEMLKHYCTEHNLNSIITFKGNQTEMEVRKAYKESHFLILPSESEGWPKVIAEAMFWGCLPIATEVSCIGNMLDFGNRGLLLKMELEQDVQQIVAILKNHSEYNNKVENGILWSRKFTLDLFEHEIKNLL